jgi:hypothetical protein
LTERRDSPDPRGSGVPDPKRSGWRRFVRENWYRDLWLFAVSVFVYVAITGNQSEAEKRRDANCVLFERNYAENVKQLQATYDYVAHLRASELGSSLNKAVILQLPDTERRASTSRPPHYCDPPDVGLKDPVPMIPSRPPGLRLP